MKYEEPEILELTPAIDAIQGGKLGVEIDNQDASPAYADWE